MKNGLAEDFMNRSVTTCDPSITVIDALMIMRTERIRYLPLTKRPASGGAVLVLLHHLEK